MIKLICLGLCAVSLATLYRLPVPDAEVAREVRMRSADRLFLAELDARETPSAGTIERVDKISPTQPPQHDPKPEAIPIAKAVAVRPPQSPGTTPFDDTLPVRRAIPVERSTVSPTVISSPATAPTVTRILPPGNETTPGKGRASILIYRNEIIVRPATQ